MAVHEPEHAAGSILANAGVASEHFLGPLGCGGKPTRANSTTSLPMLDVEKRLQEQFQEKMVAGEVKRFQELLDTFTTSQRKSMDRHLCQVERFLSGFPDRLQHALHSAPAGADVATQSHATTAGGGSHKQLVPPVGLCSRVTSVDSALSSMYPPAVLPPSDSMVTIQEEYRELKKQTTQSGSSFPTTQVKRKFRNAFKCFRCHFEYYLGFNTLRRIVHSSIFGKAALTIVMLNVTFSAIVSDEEVKRSVSAVTGDETALPDWFAIVDIIFLVLFAVELSLRLLADEVFFFVGEHWKWNMLDMIVVLSTAVDTLSAYSAPNINFVRIIRLLRVIRSMKVMRIVRYFHAMRVMVLQITNSLRPMIWAFAFLGLVIMMFALVFTQGVISYFEDLNDGRITESPEQAAEAKQLGELCGSFTMSVLSLFMSISGGINWQNIVKPLMRVSPIYVGLFILYILVLMIGVLNIIVGIFVDSATNAAAKDREALAYEEIERNQALMKGLEELFDELDIDKVGCISWLQFEEVSRRNEVRARFATLELDVSHAQEVFKLIDVNDNGFVAIDEFVVGIMRSKGLAKRTDVHTLLYQISQMVKHLQRLRRWTANRFDNVEAHLTGLRREMDDGACAYKRL